MKQKLNKNETIGLIKKAINIECYVEYKNDSFIINLKGDILPKQDQQITLKSIYELMNKKFESIEKRLEKVENEIIRLNQKVDIIDNRLEIIESLPTISKEKKEKEIYKNHSSNFIR